MPFPTRRLLAAWYHNDLILWREPIVLARVGATSYVLLTADLELVCEHLSGEGEVGNARVVGADGQ
eukprot:1512438-Lingulodinium_polyedra.AAC.1